MEVTFYNYSGNPKIVDKTLGSAIATASTLKPYRPVSDLKGEIILAYNAALYAANYALLDSKYYFITDRQVLPGGQMQFQLLTDVLMSYDISNVPIIPARNTELNNPWIYDNMQPMEVAKTHYSLKPSISEGASSLDRLNYSSMHTVAGIIGGTTWEVI